jgi:hypothetical protein
MKTRYTIASTMLPGFGLGAVAVQGLHAQAKPPLKLCRGCYGEAGGRVKLMLILAATPWLAMSATAHAQLVD